MSVCYFRFFGLIGVSDEIIHTYKIWPWMGLVWVVSSYVGPEFYKILLCIFRLGVFLGDSCGRSINGPFLEADRHRGRGEPSNCDKST